MTDMEAYTDFAGVYDIFMDETPYAEWAAYLMELIEQYGISKPYDKGNTVEGELTEEQKLACERNLVVDLGCGTGNLTKLLAEAGYDMIGVDNSIEMLQIAKEKAENDAGDAVGHNILYLWQDMRELELYSTVGTVISVCDSINYLLSDEDLLKTFRQVNNYLYPGGIFIFDFNTVYKYEEIIGDATIAENREECSFIWENYYHPQERMNEYDVTVFVREEGEYYRKFTETHYQRGYTAEQMKGLLEQAGLSYIDAVDADTHGPVTRESERIYMIARESGKL